MNAVAQWLIQNSGALGALVVVGAMFVIWLWRDVQDKRQGKEELENLKDQLLERTVNVIENNTRTTYEELKANQVWQMKMIEHLAYLKILIEERLPRGGGR